MARRARSIDWATAATALVLGCFGACAGPEVRQYQAKPPVASGPATPVCTNRSLGDAAGSPGIELTCRGDHTVTYHALMEVGLQQAARSARAAGKLYLSLIASELSQTSPGRNAVICTQRTEGTEWFCSGGKCMPQWWTTPQSTTTCSGGDPTPGTEGHLLRVVYAFLDESAAASATGATRVADVLDRR